MGGHEIRPVVIVGADHPTGLGMARALAGRNCRIVGIYRNSTPCYSSKVWDKLVQIKSYDEIVSHLVRMGQNNKKKAPLFLASDNVVKEVSDQRDRLKEYYLFRLPPKKIVDCFLDKTLFHEWAIENGFKVPASYVCSSQVELEECLKHIPFPVIIKPFEKTELWDQVSPIYKAFLLHHKDELKSVPFDLFSVASKFLVQQWIPGGDGNVFFCLVYYNGNGKKLAEYTGRKLFQWPPLSGSTAAAIGEDNDEVSRITQKMFNLIRFQGLGSMEFKRSEVDGQFYIIEPTVGRNDLQSGVAFAGGINLPAIALADVTGTRAPALKKRKAVWIHEEGLLEALKAYQKMGILQKRDLFKLLSLHTKFAILSMHDPLPAWKLLRYILWRKIFKNRLTNRN